DNFLTGGNGEALAQLRALGEAADPAPAPAPELIRPRSVWLWGEPGSGKTHLLAALAAASGDRALPLGPSAPPRAFATPPAGRLVVIDDCDQLDAPRQEAVFHLYNRVQAASGSAFVAAGRQPPLGLSLRDDLRTRLGWGVVLRLLLLTDDEKA